MFNHPSFETSMYADPTQNVSQDSKGKICTTDLDSKVIPAQQQQEQQQQEPSKAKICAKRFSTLLLSQLGTFVIVIVYVIMGGFLFEYLEQENEISGCSTKFSKFSTKRNEIVDRVYNMAQGSNATVSKEAIYAELTKFSTELFTLGVDPKINCSTLGLISSNPTYWNFANSVYFCATLVTTIGYGHIAPATMWGQIVCMIYGILGIPIMLLFLTKIGEPTAVMFKGLYLNICCCKCFVKNLSKEERQQLQLKQMKQQQQQQQQQRTQWSAVGENGEMKQPPAKVCELLVVDHDEDEDSDDGEDDIVNIPITITILLLILYILLGAAVFRVWEKWTLVEGTYFSFITLSTIGFGDLVPGKDGPFDSSWVITELLVAAVYCIFGLTVLSMCINLIQDEISAKLHWIALKLGLVDRRRRLSSTGSSGSDDSSDSDECGSDLDDSCQNGKGMGKPEFAVYPEPQKQQQQQLNRAVMPSARRIAYDSEA